MDWLIDWRIYWSIDWLIDKALLYSCKGCCKNKLQSWKICLWLIVWLGFYSVTNSKGETFVTVFYHCFREAPYRVEPDPSPVYYTSSRRTICSPRRPHSCTRLWRQTPIFPTRARATRRRNPTRWPYHPRAPRTRVRRFVPRTSSAIVGRDEMQAVRGFWRGRGARRRRIA